ncbi:hypothetical protein M0805_006210 [Coniferiporia weirii]|nr:hypothetical protein M0805_006210 [Coniferiporia weirii]
MYDFTDSGDADKDDALGESLDQPGHSAESEREWSRMSDQFVNAGYREGITAGKESALQGGFDGGFAEVGAPIGRHIGTLRGLAAGVLAFLNSSNHNSPQTPETNPLLEEVRTISDGLGRLRFADLEPPDTEALAHALEHPGQGGDAVSRMQADASTGQKALPELEQLKEDLVNVLKKLELDVVLDATPSCMT